MIFIPVPEKVLGTLQKKLPSLMIGKCTVLDREGHREKLIVGTETRCQGTSLPLAGFNNRPRGTPLGTMKGQESHVEEAVDPPRRKARQGQGSRSQFTICQPSTNGLESASDLNTIITIARPARDTGTVTDERTQKYLPCKAIKCYRQFPSLYRSELNITT